MAQGQLPLYYKNSKAVGPGAPKKRWKEYYLLVVTLFGFLMLYAGVLWFVPSVDEGDDLKDVYRRFAGQSSDVTDTLSEPSLPASLNSTPTPQSNVLNDSGENPRSEQGAGHSVTVSSQAPSTTVTKTQSVSASNPALQSAGKASASLDDIAEKRKKVVEVSDSFFFVSAVVSKKKTLVISPSP